MVTERAKEDGGTPWKWLAEGWRHLSARAVNALTYFRPDREEVDIADARWGLLAVDVTERDGDFRVELEAPGLARDEIDVTVDEQRVVITGTKRVEKERTEGAMHITERAFGTFQRAIPLPARVSAEGAKASYRRGVLTLTIPKATPPGARKIAISRG